MYYLAYYTPTTHQLTLLVAAHDIEPFTLQTRDGGVLYSGNHTLALGRILKVILSTETTNLALVTSTRHQQIVVRKIPSGLLSDAPPKLKGIGDFFESILDRTIGEVIGEFSIL